MNEVLKEKQLLFENLINGREFLMKVRSLLE